MSDCVKREEKKMGRGKKVGGGKAGTRRQRSRGARASGRRARSGARQGEGGKGEREGEIRGGRTRRVALDGKSMGRALKSDVGSFRRNPGTRVQGLRRSQARRRKTTLAHDLF